MFLSCKVFYGIIRVKGSGGVRRGRWDYMAREGGREGGGSRLFADTLSDSVGAELERPSGIGAVLLLAEAASLPRSPRERAFLVVSAVSVRDAGHQGGDARRRKIVRVLQSPNILEHLLHAPFRGAVRLIGGGSKLGKRHRRTGVVARGARDGAEGRDDQFPDHLLGTESARGRGVRDPLVGGSFGLGLRVPKILPGPQTATDGVMLQSSAAVAAGHTNSVCGEGVDGQGFRRPAAKRSGAARRRQQIGPGPAGRPRQRPHSMSLSGPRQGAGLLRRAVEWRRARSLVQSPLAPPGRARRKIRSPKLSGPS